MSDIKYLPMSEEHVQGVYEISMLSFHSPWSKQSIEEEAKSSSVRYIVALHQDQVIGFGGMWVIIDEGHITNIAVHPKHRQENVGSHILERLIEIASKESLVGMTLEVRVSNINAQKLYTKYGFKVEGVRKGYYLDTKEDGLIMWKKNTLA
jgi:ribosomal-protein-alanine N-acetyltransferase